jgi:hypothetical protein
MFSARNKKGPGATRGHPRYIPAAKAQRARELRAGGLSVRELGLSHGSAQRLSLPLTQKRR